MFPQRRLMETSSQGGRYPFRTDTLQKLFPDLNRLDFPPHNSTPVLLRRMSGEEKYAPAF